MAFIYNNSSEILFFIALLKVKSPKSSIKYKPFLWSTLIILGADNPIFFRCLDTLINSWFLFSDEVDSIKSKLLFNL